MGGCHVLLEQSFSMQLGSLVITCGVRTYVVYPLLVPYARDGVVSIATLTCGEREMRRVSFASTLQYAHDREHTVRQDMSVVDSDVIELEPVVQRVCGVTHANGEISW